MYVHIDDSMIPLRRNHETSIVNISAKQLPDDCIDPEQPSVLTRIAGTPRLDNRLACKPIGKKYFDIFDNEIDLWSRYCCLEDFDLAHWCVMYNLSRAAVIELFRNLMIATGSNFSSSHTLFKRLHQMSYTIASNSWITGKVCYNRLPNPKNNRHNDYACFFSCKPLKPMSSSCNIIRSGNIWHILHP